MVPFKLGSKQFIQKDATFRVTNVRAVRMIEEFLTFAVADTNSLYQMQSKKWTFAKFVKFEDFVRLKFAACFESLACRNF